MKKVILGLFVLAVVAFPTMIFANGQAEASTGKSVTWVKTVDIIVPAKAGGGTDLMARALFSQVGKDSGVSCGIVNNETGNAVVAMEDVRNAKTDGSKLLFYNGGILTRIASGLYKHSIDEFTVIGVAHGLEPAYCLLVAADSGIKDVKDLSAKAKSQKLLFGCNIGGTTQVMGVQLADALGVEFKYVASGADTATLTELVGHSINVCYANVNQAKQYVESGKAIALGILDQDGKGERSSVMPDTPNMKELGYDLHFAVYSMVMGPKGMNKDLAKEIYTYVASASKNPEVVKLLEPAGMNGEYFPFEEGVKILKAEQEVYSAIFEKYGLKK